MPADLHFHSIYSDGSFTPEELADMASEKGLDTLALADHDTVEGVSEMVEAGEKKGIDVIPAVEFSTFQGKAEIHILGYYIDYLSTPFLKKVKELFDLRLERARQMVEKLNELGINISYQEVEDMAADKYVGRPHIARAMIRAGYIKDMGEAFTEDYIGNGGKAYVDKYTLTPTDAIKMIKKAGGIAILAHPFFINGGNSFTREDIKGLANNGLKGIEVFHSKHDKDISAYYLGIANDLDLLISGGSDFHGENSYGIELGDVLLDDKYVDKIKAHSSQ